MTIPVYCYPVDRESAYVPLLFVGTAARYEPRCLRDASLHDVIRDLQAGRACIVHVHWEEFALRECRSEIDADAAVAAVTRAFDAIGELRGPIVWTVHNELPHEIPFREQFLELRRLLAKHADAILVHNLATIDVLARQVALDRSRVRLVPHPSYLDQYEDAASLAAGLTATPDRCIAGFGWIREQKGFGEMIGMLPVPFLQARQAYVRVSGRGPQADAVIARTNRSDIHWDVRHVPNAEVPTLLRSAACVVLPYERVLTSGVALLAMSVGAFLVSVDAPQVQDLLPTSSQRFLYERGNGDAFRSTIDRVLNLPAEERATVIAENLAVARQLHPARISERLATIYDDVLARRCLKKADKR